MDSISCRFCAAIPSAGDDRQVLSNRAIPQSVPGFLQPSLVSSHAVFGSQGPDPYHSSGRSMLDLGHMLYISQITSSLAAVWCKAETVPCPMQQVSRWRAALLQDALWQPRGRGIAFTGMERCLQSTLLHRNGNPRLRVQMGPFRETSRH